MYFVKFYKKDLEKIPTLSPLMLYRGCLKLVRTYPSSKKEEFRVGIIEEFREGKAFEDPQKIDEAIKNAQGFLRHLYTYEAVRREILDVPIYEDEAEEIAKSKLNPKKPTSVNFNLGPIQKESKATQPEFEEF